jgi:hypothetical protein
LRGIIERIYDSAIRVQDQPFLRMQIETASMEDITRIIRVGRLSVFKLGSFGAVGSFISSQHIEHALDPNLPMAQKQRKRH